MKKIIYGAGAGGRRKAHSRVNREGKSEAIAAAASFELFPFEFTERSLILPKKN